MTLKLEVVAETCTKHTSESENGKVETWLILPEVICLFQRLSHAALRILLIRGIWEWLIISGIIYLIVQS